MGTQLREALESRIAGEIGGLRNDLLGGAGEAMDTLAELAAALGNDANFATTVTAALANRVRFDDAQTLTLAQKAVACANIGVGNPDADFVAAYAAAKA